MLEAKLDIMRDLNHNTKLTIRYALRKLMDDNALIINKVDKGSTIVVQKHKDYALAGFNHLIMMIKSIGTDIVVS